MEKKLLLLSVFTTLVGLLVVFATYKANATSIPSTKVTICHRNDDANNPYIQETPDANGDVDGHNDHTGPVATSIAVAQSLKSSGTKWGDIIPPFTYYYCADHGYQLSGSTCTKGHSTEPASIGSYAGLNWTTDGQTVWNNSCGYPSPTPTPTSGPTATPTTDPCANNACVSATPTPTTIPGTTVTPADPTATPTPTGFATATPTPTNTPSNNGGGSGGGDGRSDGLSSCPSCTQAPQSGTTQAVLGASTMAGTGTFEENTMNVLGSIGIILMSISGVFYAKTKKVFSN